jgi:4,5-DOPA dioxygenase extradiol
MGLLLVAQMPVLFVGHGSPMNAIEDNAWSRAWRGLAGLLPRPKAILSVSAHWYVPGTYLTAQAHPPTIHDFGGFPQELYEIEYPAAGQPDLAERVVRLLGRERASLDGEWGLDHGTWSVLRLLYPAADVPVVQLSIDHRLSPAQHHEMGRALADLRGEGVLVFGTGNATHNLRDAFGRMRSGDSTTPDWARRFDDAVRDLLAARDAKGLVGLWPDGDDGRRSHPTGDHWLPMIYAAAAAGESEPRFPIEGFDAGSLSMRSVIWG